MQKNSKKGFDAFLSTHISQVSHSTARKKIEVKVALLEYWGRTGVPWKRDVEAKYVFDQNGQKILEHVPDSENEVRRWKQTDNSDGIIAQALNEMLQQELIQPDHVDAFGSYDAAALTPGGIQKIRNKEEKAHYFTLKQNLNRALEILKATKERQLESENKHGLISELNSRLKTMDSQRESAALQSLADRKELRALLARWKEAEERYMRREKEMKALLAEKDEQIALLDAKVRDLVKERQKVIGLNNTKGSPNET
jgi:hypothetical protein